jgi:hypothetical protein
VPARGALDLDEVARPEILDDVRNPAAVHTA